MGIIVDLFAGGGGASQGIFEALGRHPDAAVNHDPQAIAIHAANHPDTEHWCQDVWQIEPSWVSRGRPVALLWASPDCTHHSKAKGGPPKRDEKRRDLAMVITHSCPPATTERPLTRKRLFLIARRDGLPIVWPEPTHGAPESPEVLAGRHNPWRTAAEIIDWSLPCPSIFASSQEIWEQYGLRAVRPLAEATMRRIAKGIQRFVLNDPAPFIMNVAHTTKDGSYDCFRGASLDDPVPTITQTPGLGVIMPFLQHVQHSHAVNGVMSIDEPVRTITAYPKGGGMALIAPFLIKNYSGVVGKEMQKPLDTITTIDHHALVAPHIMVMYGTSTGQDCGSPLRTIVEQNKFALVYSFFVKYYGCGEGAKPLTEPVPTATGKDRFALITVIGGEKYALADIGMRMLAPHELLAAQGFPPDYTLDAEIDGKKITKSARIAMIGNSVCPPLAKKLAASNYVETPLKPKLSTLSLTIPRKQIPNHFLGERSRRSAAVLA
jgi:DNA (cytosine-5)-methyltransferase 1